MKPKLNYSLETRDIEGAQAKQRHYHINRKIQPFKIYSRSPQHRSQNLCQSFSRKKYLKDILAYQPENNIINQNSLPDIIRGRKHYIIEQGQVQYKDQNKEGLLKENTDRMLYTKDIGATAGSLINKAMKNKMIANKKIMEVKKNNDMDLYYNNHLNFRSVGQDVIRNRNGLYQSDIYKQAQDDDKKSEYFGQDLFHSQIELNDKFVKKYQNFHQLF